MCIYIYKYIYIYIYVEIHTRVCISYSFCTFKLWICKKYGSKLKLEFCCWRFEKNHVLPYSVIKFWLATL